MEKEKADPYHQYEIREGLAFLIELSPAILTPLAELGNESQLYEILNCVNDLLSDMVVAFPFNGVGIYFYNLASTGSKYPRDSGISKVFSLNDLNSSNMKTLNNTLRDHVNGQKSLSMRYQPAEHQRDNLHTVLKTVLREFQHKPQYNVKKLFWFTNNEKPYTNEVLKDSLRTMISDFEDNEIFIKPFFLDTFDSANATQPFDLSRYQNIFLNTNYMKSASLTKKEPLWLKEEESSELKVTVTSQIRQLIARIKEVRRIQFSCDLILSDGQGIGGRLGCSVKGYTLYNHEKIKHFRQVYTKGEHLKIINTDSRNRRSDTLEQLDEETEHKNEIFKGVLVKSCNDGLTEPNEKVLLLLKDTLDFMKSYAFDHNAGNEHPDLPEIGGDSQSEDDIVEYLTAPYLKLLCFRDQDNLQPYLNLKEPVFVAADFANGLGSTTKSGGYANSFNTFKSLYQSCVKLKRYAVLFGCTKRNSNPGLYSMVPTNNGELEQQRAKTPDGFLLFRIPWIKEFRSLPDHILSETYFHQAGEESAPKELVALYDKLVDQFGVWEKYDPSQHGNPTLGFFYKTIKHEALQMDVTDEDQSLVANDWSAKELTNIRRQIEKNEDTAQLFQIINAFLTQVGNSEGLKRSADVNRDPSKRPRGEPLSEAAIITHWQNDTWQSVTVAQLREFMGKYEAIKRAQKKSDMIANIIEFLESRRRHGNYE